MNYRYLFSLIFVLCVENHYSQVFSTINFDLQDGLPSSQVYDTYVDDGGYAWFTTDRGISRFDGNNFETFTTENGLSNNVNFRFYPTEEGKFWLNGLNGKFSFWDGNNFSSFKYNDLLEPILNGGSKWFVILDVTETHITFCKDLNQKLCPETIYIINLKTGDLESNPAGSNVEVGNNLSNQTIIDLSNCDNFLTSNIKDRIEYKNSISHHVITGLIDSKGNEWFGTYDGLYLFPGGDTTSIELLSKVSISGITECEDAGYWISTLNNGVYYLPSLEVKNLNFSKVNLNRAVRRIKNYNDTLRMLTEGNKFLNYVKSDESLTVYDQFANDKSKKGEKFMNEVYSIERLSTGELLSYSGTGIKLGRRGIKKNHWTPNIAERALSCLEDNDKNVWVGTTSSLYNLNLKDSEKQFKKVNTPWDKSDLRINKITKGANHIWFASTSHGLIYYSNEIFKKIDDDRILSNSVNCVLEANDSTLWVGTNRGLNKIIFETSTGKLKIDEIYSYNKTSGLNSDYIGDMEFWNDRLYLSSNTGVFFFDPSRIKTSRAKPQVHINDFKVNQVAINSKEKLKSFQNNVSIKYVGTSINRLPREKLAYRYRLKGSEWTYSNENEVHFNQLPYGKYIFQVQFRNLNSIWSDIASSEFEISPSVTQTIWFKILASCLVLFGIGYFILSRDRRIKKRNKLENSYREIELANLRSQINPHFIFNSLNTLQSFIFLDEPEKANEYLGKFSSLIRSGLEDSRKESISLEEEVDFIKLYLALEKERFSDKFDFEVIISKELEHIEIEIPPMLTQPIVENALKHAFKNAKEKGELKVSYELHNSNTLKVEIEDNGQGYVYQDKYEKNKSHNSMGLAMTTDRILKLKEKYKGAVGSLTVHSEISKGTRVVLLIPFGKELK